MKTSPHFVIRCGTPDCEWGFPVPDLGELALESCYSAFRKHCIQIHGLQTPRSAKWRSCWRSIPQVLPSGRNRERNIPPCAVNILADCLINALAGVLTWDDPMRGAPSNYLSRCEAALAAYENGGELPPGWYMPPVCSEDDDPNEPFDPAEPPPEPPETLNVLEHQRYISKLIHWGLEASKREQSRPHLVERDNDPEDES